MVELRADVVVVGAGPSGSTSAILLSRLGYDVLLLDKSHFPRPKPCGEYLSPGVTDTLRQLDLGMVAAEGAMFPLEGMEIVSPANRVLRVSYRRHGAQLLAHTMPRATLDNSLLDHAKRAGTRVMEGFVARTPIVSDGVVRGVAGSLAGDEARVSARLTIVADGTRSVLSRKLGLARPPRWPVRLGLVAYYEGRNWLPDRFGQMHVSLSGYCGIAPLGPESANVAMVVREDAVARSGQSATEFYSQWLARHPGTRRALAGCRRVTPVRGVGPIGSRTTRSWVPGALLVGDAAGFFDPFTGEGIFRALQGADLAARVAHAALQRGTVGDRGLSPYGRLRVESFRWKSLATSLVQCFVQYPALMEYALPRIASRPIPDHTLSMVLGDVMDARRLVNPRMLWSALRP
ncbi:MAG: geranylgeranyl reductase family protein [Chloroflexota bacterium]|nr:geranylgeranyl reductase family protein [Chloroflexota bacterium]